MSVKLYNTLTRRKEELKPINENQVTIYSCGPTVYDYAHIGNFRAYLFMDNLRRVLKYNGFHLKHAMNITDVGHLVSDADEGEDKMLKASRRENKSPFEIAAFYTQAFLEDMKKLNIDMPEIICKATEHIGIMENYVKQILANGYAYETQNTIYFDTAKLDQYGVLSNRNTEEQKAGARVELDSEKRNPTDFALWIKAPKNHLMKWNSFWGECYPGWHLECSAMSEHYLGDVFDIHTGGMDHIPIHHENEIAQAKGYCGKIPAHYWMHVDFLQVNGGKMSKSLHNLYTLKDLEEKGYSADVYRMFNFSSHYKKPINFTFEAMDAAKTALYRLREGYKRHTEGNEIVPVETINEFESQFKDAINDDLNMTQALSVVWEVIKFEKKSQQLATLLLKFDTVLGLQINKKEKVKLPVDIQNLIDERKTARENKNWKKSDELRDKLISLGYTVKDTKEGMIVEFQK